MNFSQQEVIVLLLNLENIKELLKVSIKYIMVMNLILLPLEVFFGYINLFIKMEKK